MRVGHTKVNRPTLLKFNDDWRDIAHNLSHWRLVLLVVIPRIDGIVRSFFTRTYVDQGIALKGACMLRMLLHNIPT